MNFQMLSKPHRKILLIVLVMIASYVTLLAIITYSKKLAETESEATQEFNN